MTELYVALDFDDADEAWVCAQQLDSSQCGVKIGKELFTSTGPDFVRRCVDRGFRVFLDLKFHDIPNTVAGAVRAAVALGVTLLNVHASGGLAMMQAARDARDIAARDLGLDPPTLIAVTLLTSLDVEDCNAIGFSQPPGQQVMRLAELVDQAGLDGVVCSAHEAASLRDRFGADFYLCTPGIRLADDPAHDQRRVMSPGQARLAGSHAIVMGRSITQKADPQAVVHRVLEQLKGS